jgi:hypothetical protein
MINSKKELGQFFTTNTPYILQGLESYINGKSVLDPFAGTGELLNWAKQNGAISADGLDIDYNLIKDNIKFNDSLINIPKSDFIITNPPYIGRHIMSNEQKSKYPVHEYEDFYLLAVQRIIDSFPEEGIIIIPVNFFSAENSDKVRVEFLDRYVISKINYFKQQVFKDTQYNVVAFHFYKKPYSSNKQIFNFNIFPEKKQIFFGVEKQFNYRIAGKELYKFNLKTNAIRLTDKIIKANPGENKISTFFNDKNTVVDYLISDQLKELIDNNIIYLSCVDTCASESGWIKIDNINNYGKKCLVGKKSSRNYAYIMFPDIPLKYQEQIIILFNKIVNDLRYRYESLFLTNYRNKNRKRISYEFCYKIIHYCYQTLIEKNIG